MTVGYLDQQELLRMSSDWRMAGNQLFIGGHDE